MWVLAATMEWRERETERQRKCWKNIKEELIDESYYPNGCIFIILMCVKWSRKSNGYYYLRKCFIFTKKKRERCTHLSVIRKIINKEGKRYWVLPESTSSFYMINGIKNFVVAGLVFSSSLDGLGFFKDFIVYSWCSFFFVCVVSLHLFDRNALPNWINSFSNSEEHIYIHSVYTHGAINIYFVLL